MAFTTMTWPALFESFDYTVLLLMPGDTSLNMPMENCSLNMPYSNYMLHGKLFNIAAKWLMA
jgi:hypothetical protein